MARLIQYLAGPMSPIVVFAGTFPLARVVARPGPRLLLLSLPYIGVLQLGMGCMVSSVALMPVGDLPDAMRLLGVPSATLSARAVLFAIGSIGVALAAVGIARVARGAIWPTGLTSLRFGVAEPSTRLTLSSLVAMLGVNWVLAILHRLALARSESMILELGEYLMVVVPAILIGILGLRARHQSIARLSVVYGIVMLLVQYTSLHPISISQWPRRLENDAAIEQPVGRATDFDAIIESAEMAEVVGRVDEAARMWAAAREMSPTQSFLAFRHGIALFRLGELEEARHALEASYELLQTGIDRGNEGLPPHIEHWLGRIALRDVRLREACEHFTRQLEAGWSAEDSQISGDPKIYLGLLGEACERGTDGPGSSRLGAK